MIPTLPSGLSVWGICGEIVYTLTCVTDPTLPFTVSDMAMDADSDRGVLKLKTKESIYAIDDSDPSDIIYEKDYTFSLTA